MIIDERQSEILTLLKVKNFLSYKEISEKLYCSISTIRRDIQKMSEKGLINMIKGGISSIDTTKNESSLAIRQQEHNKEKRKIAQKASKFVVDGNSYLMDGSTTTYQIAYYLKDFQKAIVVTNSIDVASLIKQLSDINVYLVGGLFNDKTKTTGGYFIKEMINQFYCDYCFISCKGISNDGFVTDANIDTQKCKFEMINNSKKRILLIDNSKLGKSFLFKTCSLKDIDVVVLDKEPSEKYLKLFEKYNVEIVY